MSTMEEYARQPREQRLQRLTRTAEQLSAAVKGQAESALSRRPDGKNWAPKEVICHLRDTEEGFTTRFDLILAMDTEPKILSPNADRMAEERQYLRNDAVEAIGAFRRRREENLELLRKLSPAQWDKGGLHPARGRMTIDAFLTLMAWHDDNHLDQLQRSLEGKA